MISSALAFVINGVFIFFVLSVFSCILCVVLRCNKVLTLVHLTEKWLFYLTCSISRNVLKYDLPWSLVSWKFFTELVDLFLCTGHAILYLYDAAVISPRRASAIPMTATSLIFSYLLRKFSICTGRYSLHH